MEIIGISPRFFTHELNNYSDWEKAFWRELVQNSGDVNATRIETKIDQIDTAELTREISSLQDERAGRMTYGGDTSAIDSALEEKTKRLATLRETYPDPDKICIISFADNGPGMDEDTLRNIYFQLGATSKEGADTIGGHGRARILTCFAHESYSIRTQNLLCKGHGGSFEIDNTLPFQKGCIVEVVLSQTHGHRMESILREYLASCQLPCAFLINDVPFTNWLYRRKATRTLSFGTVHTTKQKEYCMLIRVRGVVMFERYIGSKTGAIVEIDPVKSREMLTVSRDQLKYEAQHELNNFITEITLDNKSLSRDCSLNKTEIYGKFKKIGKKREDAVKPAPTEPKACGAGTSETIWFGQGLATAAYYIGNPPVEEPETCPLDFSVHYEDAPKSLSASARRFHKETISGNRLKLLAAWDATIAFFLEGLHTLYGEEILYLPGFVFGTGLGGLHKTEKVDAEEKGHIIYINPLDSEGKIKLSCKSIATLYAIGVHEVAHVRSDYHNEDWGGVVTELTLVTVEKTNELKTRIKNAVAEITQQNKPKQAETQG